MRKLILTFLALLLASVASAGPIYVDASWCEAGNTGNTATRTDVQTASTITLTKWAFSGSADQLIYCKVWIPSDAANSMTPTIAWSTSSTTTGNNVCFTGGIVVSTVAATNTYQNITGGEGAEQTITGHPLATTLEQQYTAAGSAVALFDAGTGVSCASTDCRNRLAVFTLTRFISLCSSNDSASANFYGLYLN